ncbi:putative quinol monooxygenase [Rubripirellula lacrimiformis]|nr:putative quinol monooxygenase [Rubripirellula lacrimiformis]
MSESLVVVASLTANAGSGDELFAAIASIIQASRAEAGCQSYICHRNIENADEIVVYEVWDDEAALQKHSQSEHFQRFLSEAKPVLKDLDVKKLTVQP